MTVDSAGKYLSVIFVGDKLLKTAPSICVAEGGISIKVNMQLSVLVTQ